MQQYHLMQCVMAWSSEGYACIQGVLPIRAALCAFHTCMLLMAAAGLSRFSSCITILALAEVLGLHIYVPIAFPSITQYLTCMLP